MSTFAIISDIHGNATALKKSFAIAENMGVDYFLLLGDILYHGPRNTIIEGYDPKLCVEILNSKKNRIIAVKGNCDSEVDQMLLQFPIMSLNNQLIVNEHKIFMTHGHKVDYETVPLEENDLLLQGHTHHVVFTKHQRNFFIFNPGSISILKDRDFGTMGILTKYEIMEINIENGQIVKTNSLNWY